MKQHKLHKCKYCNITKKRPWRLKIHENICLFNPINIKKNKKINKEKKCNCCGKIFILNSKNKNRVYCSLECKKKIYKKIFLFKEKIIKKVKFVLNIKKYSKCLICGNKILLKKRTCSKECLRKLKSINSIKQKNKGPLGHKGYYKGYWCDSSWELAYVIYNLEHNIKFERNSKGFEYIHKGEKHFYYPDFIEGNTYIEIKGRITKQWLEKEKQFQHSMKVLYKNEIKKYLDYVILKHGKDFVNLYEEKDNIRISNCKGCGKKIFIKHKKKIGKDVFCNVDCYRNNKKNRNINSL